MSRPLVLGSNGNPQQLQPGVMLSGNLAAARATVGALAFSASTSTRILYTGANINTHTQWISSYPGHLVCKNAGVYLVVASVQVGANTSTDTSVEIRLNGNTIVKAHHRNTSVVAFQTQDMMSLAVNDEVDTWFFHNQSGGLTINNARLFMYRIASA